MPELPEAETIARQLHAAIAGQTLRHVRLARRDVLRGGTPRDLRRLSGQRVRAVFRRGKRVVVELSDNLRVIFALGMTGQITLADRDAPIPAHTHLRVGIGDGSRELRFRDVRRFGGVWVANGSDEAPLPLPLGVEPLLVDLRTFRAILRRKRRIKALLLDQNLIAGIGNIYADEALHRAGIHPLARASDLAPRSSKALLVAIRRVLRAAITHRGTTLADYRTTTGEPGDYRSRHRVYQREGLPCLTCQAPIERIVVTARSTHFCPICQPKTRPGFAVAS